MAMVMTTEATMKQKASNKDKNLSVMGETFPVTRIQEQSPQQTLEEIIRKIEALIRLAGSGKFSDSETEKISYLKLCQMRLNKQPLVPEQRDQKVTGPQPTQSLRALYTLTNSGARMAIKSV